MSAACDDTRQVHYVWRKAVYLPAKLTRQMDCDPSSVTSSAPSGATATATGLPHTFRPAHESRHEILELPGRVSVDERHPNHFVTGPVRAIPGTMLRREQVAAIFGRELRPS